MIFAGVILFTLYRISIINGDKYLAKAESQYIKPESKIFSRGTIYFSSKDGIETSAASVKSGFTLYMNPMQVTDPSGTYNALSHYVNIDKKSFDSKVAKVDDPYEELLYRLSDETALLITQLGLNGIGLAEEAWRQYPGDNLAAHALGIVGQSGTSTEISGRYGLEKHYDEILGREVSISSRNLFAQIFSGITSIFYENPKSGDIVTTIEPTVQAFVEKIMKTTEDSWSPDEIGAIIMDPNTGEVIAMASHPSYDPNNLRSLSSSRLLSNPMVEHVYEMGSIMKPLTMAVALDSGSITLDYEYEDEGCIILNQKKICNYDQRARGKTDMQSVLSQSLNMGVAHIALRTGAQDFVKYFEKFGINTKSGIDLPNEAKPLADNLVKPEDIDIATASYGQGIAVSPVGMVRALSVLANGGYLIKPHVVSRINYLDGTSKKTDTRKVGPILKKSTADDVKKMLVKVVDEALAQGSIKRDRYNVAAKTGTAAIADLKNGGYYSDRWLHSFFGFFPAYNPKFIVFIYQIYPKNAKYASETLTKPFDEITGFLINYYNIPPDR